MSLKTLVNGFNRFRRKYYEGGGHLMKKLAKDGAHPDFFIINCIDPRNGAIAKDAFLADPHVQVGLVAADGGPLTWPLHISLLLAKEYALTGTRIPAERAVELGLANHVVADPVAEAVQCAQKIMQLPQQAVESTKRVLNVHLERAVLATLDYALSAENQSFQTEDFRSIVTKLAAGKN